jgi:type I restriction enzyme S subunit
MSWKTVKLKTVAKISAGQSAPKDNDFNIQTGLPFIRAGHIEKLIANSNIIELPKISKENALKNRLKVLNKGSVLFAKSGMSAMMNRVYLVDQDAYYVSHLASVTPNNEVLDSRFCYYFLMHFKTSKLIKDSAYPSIGLPDIENLEIPLPPLATQKRIAEILDAADALKRKDQELLKKYDELAQAIFIDMFGDPVKNEKGWEEIFLKDVCLKITDGTHQSPKFTDKGVPFLFVSNIVKNKITYETSTFISEEEFDVLNMRTPIEVGNILITTVGSYGNPAVIENNSPFAFQRHIAFLKPNHSLINYYYLFGFLKSPAAKNQIDRKVNGVAQKTLNLSDLKDLKIWNVPRSLQDNYSEILNKLQLQLNLSETNRSNILFNSLIQKAFKGELVS